MHRNLRKLVGSTILALASVTALGVSAGASLDRAVNTVASAHGSQASKCRWVWRHGLVCDTKLTTVNP
jgi:hypothetical protein